MFDCLQDHAATLGKCERQGSIIALENGCEFVFVYEERKKQLVENHIIMRSNRYLGGHMLGAHEDEQFIKDVMTAWYRRVERSKQC